MHNGHPNARFNFSRLCDEKPGLDYTTLTLYESRVLPIFYHAQRIINAQKDREGMKANHAQKVPPDATLLLCISYVFLSSQLLPSEQYLLTPTGKESLKGDEGNCVHRVTATAQSRRSQHHVLGSYHLSSTCALITHISSLKRPV